MKRCTEMNIVFGSLLREMIKKEKPGFDLEIKEVCAPYADKDWEYHAIKDGETIYVMSTLDLSGQTLQGYTYNEIAENYIGRAMRSYQSGEYRKEYFFSDFLAKLTLLPVDPEEYPLLKENAYLVNPPWTDNFIKGAFLYEDKFGSRRIVTRELAEKLKGKSFENYVEECKKKYGERRVKKELEQPNIIEGASKIFDDNAFRAGTGYIYGKDFKFYANVVYMAEEDCQQLGYTPKKCEGINELSVDDPTLSICEVLLFDDFLQDICRKMEEECELSGPYYILPIAGDTAFIHNFDVHNTQSNAVAEFLMEDCLSEYSEDVLISTRVFEYDPKTNEIKEVQRPKSADAKFRLASSILRPGQGEWWKEEKEWTRG